MSPDINPNQTFEVTVTFVGGTEQKIARMTGRQLSSLLSASAQTPGVYVITSDDDVLGIPGRNIAAVLARSVTR